VWLKGGPALWRAVHACADVKEEESGDDGIWEPPVQREDFGEHVTTTVGEVLLVVARVAIPEVDCLHADGQEEA
jgi:hypothetical protein